MSRLRSQLLHFSSRLLHMTGEVALWGACPGHRPWAGSLRTRDCAALLSPQQRPLPWWAGCVWGTGVVGMGWVQKQSAPDACLVQPRYYPMKVYILTRRGCQEVSRALEAKVQTHHPGGGWEDTVTLLARGGWAGIWKGRRRSLSDFLG